MENLHWSLQFCGHAPNWQLRPSIGQSIDQSRLFFDNFFIVHQFRSFAHCVWIHSMNSYFISSPVRLRRGSSEFSSRSPLINCNQPVNLTGLMWHQTKQRERESCRAISYFTHWAIGWSALLIQQDGYGWRSSPTIIADDRNAPSPKYQALRAPFQVWWLIETGILINLIEPLDDRGSSFRNDMPNHKEP